MKLDQLFELHYTWTDLFLLVVSLLIIYVLLFFLRRIIHSFAFLGRLRSPFRKFLDKVIVLYEPLAIILALGVYVMIKPGFHGLMIGALTIFSFDHVRNYFQGRLYLTNKVLKVGRRIKVNGSEGVIVELGRFGVDVRTDDGLTFLPYQALIKNGYVMSSGDKIGGYYHLTISPEEQQDDDSGMQESRAILSEVTHLLISSPYIDGDHKPEISRSLTNPMEINTKLLVKEESHLHDLISLLREHGFVSVITKS